jgi:hypothetical protein
MVEQFGESKEKDEPKSRENKAPNELNRLYFSRKITFMRKGCILGE